MVIQGLKEVCLIDKGVNNHPTQTVNHHCLDTSPLPTIGFAIDSFRRLDIVPSGYCVFQSGNGQAGSKNGIRPTNNYRRE